ncbi:MAG TPA: relaxase/mobilization nuclease domain-containing protein [Thermoanaerobaculia bacterium]|nr:relaxase/mobilization nuclease domain-containing protein [Thermoanaerobaculia bacterium]
MIGRIIKGRGFRGLLNYLAEKPGAEMVGGNMEGRNPRELAREFGFVRQSQPGVERVVAHISLRLPVEEQLTQEQWGRVAERVLAGLGYSASPYVLYRHPHAEGGHHVHIVTSRISYLGQVVSESNDYRRAMAIVRRIEKDYRLRVVPCPERGARPASQRERQKVARTGEPSMRDRLQRAVAEAAAASRTVSDLVSKLERRGVQVQPRITSTGLVAGIRYRLGPLSFTGSGLGSAFTWPGLLRHFRLDFDPARDVPPLVAAGQRFAAAPSPAPPAPPAPHAPPPSAAPSRRRPPRRPAVPTAAPDRRAASRAGSPPPPVPAGQTPAVAAGSLPSAREASPPAAPAARPPGLAAEPPSAPSPRRRPASRSPETPMSEPNFDSAPPPAAARPFDRTTDQVEHQLAALASARYDLLVLDAASGAHRHYRGAWTPEQVLAAVPWLKHENAQGGEILVRPVAPLGYSHLAGVNSEALAVGRKNGFEPAAVLRAADGSREVWLRAGREIPPQLRLTTERALARRFRAARPPEAPGYGHLAGFTSPLAQRARGLARPPFLSLDEAGGQQYRSAPALAAAAAKLLVERDFKERLDRELDFHPDPRPTASPGDGAGPPVSSLLSPLLRAADAEAARQGLAAAPPHSTEIARGIKEIEAARRAYAEAWTAVREAAPDDARAGARAPDENAARRDALEQRVVDSYRSLRAVEDSLADRLGLQELPATLKPEPLEYVAYLQHVVLRAEARSFELETTAAAAPTDRLEAAVALRTLREELADRVRQSDLGPLASFAPAGEALPAEAPSPPAVLEPLGSPGPAAPHPASAGVPSPTAGDPHLAPAAESPFRPPEPPVHDEAYIAGHQVAAARLSSIEALAARPAGEVQLGDSRAATPTTDEAVSVLWTLKLAHELGLEAREATLARERRALATFHEQSSLALDALEPRLEREAAPSALRAYDALVTRLPELEQRLETLGGRLARLAEHRLGRDLERLERALLQQPTENGLTAYARLLDQRREVDSRLQRASDPARSAPPRALAPTDDETTAAKAAFRQSADRLLHQPSREAVADTGRDLAELRALQARARAARSTAELRAARKELRRAGDELLRAARDPFREPIPPPLRARWRSALIGYQRAEAARARLLDVGGPGGPGGPGGAGRPRAPGELAPLLRRLGRGDWSPDNLARLQRALARELRPAGGIAAPPRRDDRPYLNTLPELLAVFRDDQAALRAAARRLTPERLRQHAAGPPGVDAGAGADIAADLERLREALGHYQSSRARLEARTQREARGPESRLGPLAYYLDHPGFAGQPHRAVAAWTAHAQAQGVAAERVPEIVESCRRSRSASPRLLSRGSSTFTVLLLRELVQRAHQAGREYAHER